MRAPAPHSRAARRIARRDSCRGSPACSGTGTWPDLRAGAGHRDESRTLRSCGGNAPHSGRRGPPTTAAARAAAHGSHRCSLARVTPGSSSAHAPAPKMIIAGARWHHLGRLRALQPFRGFRVLKDRPGLGSGSRGMYRGSQSTAAGTLMATSTARIIAIIAATLSTSVALGAQRTFDKQLSAPPGGRLTFDADVGSVSIVGHDAPEVVVHADLEGSESLLDRLHISAEQTASGVRVSAHATHDGWLDWFNWGSTRVDFTIEVPRNYPVDLRTSGGGIEVRELNAAVLGKTSGGGIRLQNINGGITMHTSGGGIDA